MKGRKLGFGVDNVGIRVGKCDGDIEGRRGCDVGWVDGCLEGRRDGCEDGCLIYSRYFIHY